jgi:hypothetical protein
VLPAPCWTTDVQNTWFGLGEQFAWVRVTRICGGTGVLLEVWRTGAEAMDDKIVNINSKLTSATEFEEFATVKIYIDIIY